MTTMTTLKMVTITLSNVEQFFSVNRYISVDVNYVDHIKELPISANKGPDALSKAVQLIPLALGHGWDEEELGKRLTS